MRAAVARFASSDMEKRLRLYHGDNAESMFHGWADIWLSPQLRYWTIPGETLGAIEAPVLAMQGADDEYGSAEQLLRIEAGVAAAARTILIPDCAHEPHVQARETVMDEAINFIETINTKER